MLIEAPSNNPFSNIGDSIRGRYIEHHFETGMEGKQKLMLTLQTKQGEKSFNCPTDLKARVLNAAGKGLLKPTTICTCTYTENKSVGKPQPMKVITLDIEEGKSAKAPPPPADGDDEEIPF